jgi:hypothetical protein
MKEEKTLWYLIVEANFGLSNESGQPRSSGGSTWATIFLFLFFNRSPLF